MKVREKLWMVPVRFLGLQRSVVVYQYFSLGAT